MSKYLRALLCALLCLASPTLAPAQSVATYTPSQITDISGLATSLSGKSAKGVTAQVQNPWMRRVPCSWSRMMINGQVAGSYGTSRLYYPPAVASHDFECVFGNFVVGASGDTPSTNSIYVQAAIEYPANTFYPLTFGGHSSVVIDPMGMIKSDPVYVDIPAGGAAYVRTYVSVQLPPASAPTVSAGSGGSLAAATYFYKVTSTGPTGESGPSSEGSAAVSASGTATITWTAVSPATSYTIYRSTATGAEKFLANVSPYSLTYTDTGAVTPTTANPPAAQTVPTGPLATTSHGASEVTNIVSGTGTGTNQITTSGTAWAIVGGQYYVFGPLAMVGIPDAGLSSTAIVAVVGDSIAYGQNSIGDQGFIAKALQVANIPYWYMPKSGELGSGFLTGSSLRMGIAGAANYAVNEYGTNDVLSGASLATLKASFISQWTSLHKRGLTVYQTTVLPKTTSTDSFATATNQTPAATETVRTGFNDWLRDTSASGAVAQSGGNLTGVFDITVNVEVNASNTLALDGGRWLTNGTAFAYCDSAGTHPSLIAVNLIYPSVNTAKFVAP